MWRAFVHGENEGEVTIRSSGGWFFGGFYMWV